MEQNRKEETSIYYWVKDLLPSFVAVTTEFPKGELKLPTVAVIGGKTRARPLQLGGSDLDHKDWAIYVFAQNVGQRDDYLNIIHKNAENCILVYDYNVGFPPTVNPPKIGSLSTDDRNQKPLHVYEELVKKKYWWGVVLFTTYFNPV
jgi:hypothetical protein